MALLLQAVSDLEGQLQKADYRIDVCISCLLAIEFIQAINRSLLLMNDLVNKELYVLVLPHFLL